jgi:release factor glutamine methyltransferase
MASDIGQLLRFGKERLAVTKISLVDAELILAHLLGISRMELHSQAIDLPAEDLIRISEEFDEAISERLLGRPTQYIIGEAHFRYLSFDVGEGVLIPRPETELLVDEVLHQLHRYVDPISIVDLGSGSGAIAISLVSETAKKREVRVVAVEKESAALIWLNQNIAKFDLPIRVVHASAADALVGVKCDIVVANPPYVPMDQELPAELLHEPSQALFGGSTDGMAIPSEFITAASRLLKPGGLFACEHNELQGPAFADALSNDFEEILLHRDLNDRPRFTTAIRRS